VRKFFPFVITIIILIGLLVGGCTPKVESDVAAVVNGEKITRSDVDREVEMVPFNMPLLRRAGFAAEEQRKLVLLNLIETTLIRQEAEKNGIKITDRQIMDRYKMFRAGKSREAFVQELNRWGMNEKTLLKQLEAKLVAEKLFAKVVKPRKVPEEELKDYYNRKKDRFKDMTYEQAKALILPVVSAGKQAEAQKAWLDRVKTESDIRLYNW
jgi:parvulin-like peptidyl-prolyl isomerase